MGIFSDEDLTELDKKFKDTTLDQRIRKTFLEGFENGRGLVKSEYMKERVAYILHDVLEVYKNYEKFKTNAHALGNALGEFVGILRYSPTIILRNTVSSLVIDIVHTLKSYPDQRYYGFIEKRMKRWAKVINKQFESLDSSQKYRYKVILGRV